MILLIDDDYSITASLALLLKQAGYTSVSAATPDEALARLRDHEIDLVLQDMNFSRRTTGEEGLALLERIRSERADVPVILITAWGSIELAVAGVKAGAADFITKPWNNDQILHAVRTAMGLVGTRRQVGGSGQTPTRSELDARYDLTGVVGTSPKFLEALDIACRVSRTDASVLITGDSGTGKEVVAEAIHRNSPRSRRSMVRVNLAGIPTTLFESEMFGHVKGAFTDARADRQGRFAMANGGTIFLDEIGELDLACQVKLLRVVQERTYEVLGSSRSEALDVRVISATNRDLGAAVRDGSFREDLLYRINLITVRLPSLIDRREDIASLSRHFAREIGAAYGRPDLDIDDRGLQWLTASDWPGNVRQLRHTIERTILVSEAGVLTHSDLTRAHQLSSPDGGEEQLPAVGSMTMGELEKAMILKSLRYHGGNVSRVAESLGLSRAALYRRLEKYGIQM